MAPAVHMRTTGSGRVVALWVLAEHDVAAVARVLGAHRLLDAAERRRLARLRLPGARRRFLGGRLLAR